FSSTRSHDASQSAPARRSRSDRSAQSPHRSPSPVAGRRESPGSKSPAFAARSRGGASMRHELQQVEPGDNAYRPLGIHDDQGGGPTQQRVEGFVDVGAGGNGWKGPVHGGPHRGFDQARVPIYAIE